jgi:hypothetical protein
MKPPQVNRRIPRGRSCLMSRDARPKLTGSAACPGAHVAAGIRGGAGGGWGRAERGGHRLRPDGVPTPRNLHRLLGLPRAAFGRGRTCWPAQSRAVLGPVRAQPAFRGVCAGRGPRTARLCPTSRRSRPHPRLRLCWENICILNLGRYPERFKSVPLRHGDAISSARARRDARCRTSSRARPRGRSRPDTSERSGSHGHR